MPEYSGISDTEIVTSVDGLVCDSICSSVSISVSVDSITFSVSSAANFEVSVSSFSVSDGSFLTASEPCIISDDSVDISATISD